MNFKAIFKTAFVLLLFAALALGLLSYARKYPENLPWTKLDLTRPIGTFTGRKLAGLNHDAPRCQALLDDVGVAYSVLPPVHEGRCGYADAVRISKIGRASCRERVWQDVKITVGDGLMKKKRTTKQQKN